MTFFTDKVEIFRCQNRHRIFMPDGYRLENSQHIKLTDNIPHGKQDY